MIDLPDALVGLGAVVVAVGWYLLFPPLAAFWIGVLLMAAGFWRAR